VTEVSTQPIADSGSEEFLFPQEPAKFNENEFHRLLVYMSQKGASDIKIQTNNAIYAKIHGVVRRITRRDLPPQEAEHILSVIYGPNGPSVLKDGRDIDKGYELHPSRAERYRYRVNAVGGVTQGQRGLEITIRTISIEPPTMEQLKVEPGIIEGVFPKDGIVIVVGPTGSGKSTLISSFLRHILEKPDANKFITTFESPIEYVYDTIRKPSSVIWQTEIGPSSDLKNFYEGIRNAMRRAPDIIFTGESRDIESIEGTMAASQSGHAVYTTVHANSVVDTFRRIVNFFPHSSRHGAMNNLISTTRMVIWQRLFIRPDGKGRVAVREFVHLTDDLREELLSIGADNMDRMLVHLKKIVDERGQSAGACARRYYDEGLLSPHDLIAISSNEL
jgi:defect-in-organelle-trafficking protein DotB